MEKRYIGIDLHRNRFTCCIRLEKERTYVTEWALEDLERFARKLRPSDEVAVEYLGGRRSITDNSTFGESPEASNGTNVEGYGQVYTRTIAQSLTGPVAFSVSIIGIFATGATLMWGGEMNEFARRAALMGLIVAVIVFATNIQHFNQSFTA